MNWLNNLVNWQTSITPNNDKLAHFWWGFWYSLIGYFIFHFTGFKISVILLPLILAIMNELRNYYGKGKAEFMDIVFTILPAIVIYFL